MVSDETQLESACDPEQAGIMVDRLATELQRAELANPQALPALIEDARQLLTYLGDWLLREPNDLAVNLRNITPSGDIEVLVQNLRCLAEELFELADRQNDSWETSDLDFDPQSVASALHVLKTEIGPELFGDDAQQALLTLRIEFGHVVARARAWAARRGLGAEAIPDVPARGASPQDCILALQHLGGVLEELGQLAAKARNGPS